MRIALAGNKGGSGKSTTAIALAVEWHRRGRTVLVVDADIQATVLTWSQIAAEEEQDIPTVISMRKGLNRKDQLPKIAKDFDVVIIDCPGRSGTIQRQAIAFSDVVVLPSSGTAADAWSLAESAEIIEEAQSLRPNLEAYILLTRHQWNTAVGQGAREALEDLDIPLLDSSLGFRVAFQDALSAGMGPTNWEPSSAASKEVKALCDELEEVETELALSA